MDKQELREIAENARPENSQSHLNCRPINEKIGSALEKKGIECEVIDGRMSRYELRGEGPAHSFVIVTDEALDCSVPIIIDGAVEQFCRENLEKGYVTFSLGKKEELPTVAVVAQGDKLYENYFW